MSLEDTLIKLLEEGLNTLSAEEQNILVDAINKLNDLKKGKPHE